MVGYWPGSLLQDTGLGEDFPQLAEAGPVVSDKLLVSELHLIGTSNPQVGLWIWIQPHVS